MFQTKQALKKLYYTIFVAPGVLIYSLIVIFPIFFSAYLGFHEWAGFGEPQWVGLDNYQKIFSDPVFHLGLKNNILIIVISLLGQIPIGLVMSYLIYRKMIRFDQLFQAMIFLPVAISAAIVAILWNQIFAPGGMYTSLIRNLTNDPNYVVNVFENKTYAIVPILVVMLWYYTGIYMIIFVANMRRISDSVIEAAIIDGAKEKDIFFRIVLPSMITVIFTTVVFAVSGSLKSFDLIFVMTGGGPAHYTEVISIYMYLNTFKYYKYGFGSGVSIIIVFLSLILIGLLKVVFNKLEKKYG